MNHFGSQRENHSNYRPDIDGLRAVAILAVVGFHAWPRLFPGGFIGVDVFFVISGFLLSGLVMNDLQANRFSFGGFYARRVRRIFPALLLVLAFVWLAGWGMLLPDEFRALGQHIRDSAFFLSNLRLYREAGYFNPISDFKPLLHLWSLAVEEQFYLVLPGLLFLLRRFRLDSLYSILLLLLLSFACNLIQALSDPAAAFYLPFSRFWEILLGAACFAMQAKIGGLPLGGGARDLFASVGLALLAAGAFFCTGQSPYLGVSALLPTLGALALVMAEGSWLNRRALAHPWMIFVGLISYPLYLWHWPLLSLYRIAFPDDSSQWAVAAIVALAFALAWFTYHFLERPIRFAGLPACQAVFPLCALSLMLCGLGALSSTGVVRPRIAVSPEAALDDWTAPPTLFENGRAKTYRLQGRENEEVLFLGDSHLEQYWPRIKHLTDSGKAKYSAIYAAHSGCLPVPHSDSKVCDKVFQSNARLGFQPQVKRIVVSCLWEQFLSQSQRAKWLGELEAYLEALRGAGKEIYIVLSGPIGWEFHPLSSYSRWSGRPLSRSYDLKKYAATSGPLMEKLRAFARRAGAKVIDPIPYMCGRESCPTTFQDEPIYRDMDHLRASYARENAVYIDQTLE